jgi:ornithine cyclodeaminase/alanine dehydrogenase-like protein (mu-crystallin family)
MKQAKHMAFCWLAIGVLIGTTACTPASAARGPVPASNTSSVMPGENTVGNTAAELRRLMDAQQLTELRTTYNGTYGASLLFHAESLNYYVALFHDKEFWRVIRTDSADNAEQVYRTFVDQTAQLSQVYIDTIRLQAGKAYTDRMVQMNEKRLQGLQQELEAQRQQGAQVSAALQQNKQEAVTLSSDLRNSNSQLDALQQRIKTLQAQQGDPSLALPATAPAAAEAAPGPAPTKP